MSLTTLKVASVAGRLAGFPVPNVAALVDRWLDGQLKTLETLKGATFEVIAVQTKDPKLATKELERLSAYATSVVDSMISGAKPIDGPALTNTLQEPIKKSLEELDALLKKSSSDWQKKCGLVKVTSKDGTTEWVLEKHAAEFEDKGADFIKTTYGVKDDDLDRTIAKKNALANALRELEAIEADVRADTTNFESAYNNLGGTSRADAPQPGSLNGSSAPTLRPAPSTARRCLTSNFPRRVSASLVLLSPRS